MPDVEASRRAFSGHLRLGARYRENGYTVLAEQAFRAPFHLSKPYSEGKLLVVQVVNPTAGVLEGDVLESDIRVAPGGALLVSTPSATRLFTMRSGRASGRQHFEVGPGAWLEMAPEPLVPHAGSRFHQRTTIDVAEEGEGLWADLFMPGRLARGEAWAWAELGLTLEVRVGGRLALCEQWRHSGLELRRLASLAGAGEGACFANLVVVSHRLAADKAWRDRIRNLNTASCRIGLSPLRTGENAWSIRLVAADSIRLRDGLAAVRATLAALLPHLGVSVRKL